MAHASARYSFHGPLMTPRLRSVRAEPTTGSVGRAVLAVARAEQPSSGARERILQGVLSALKRLTGSPE